MGLPPGRLLPQLATTFPQLTLCDAALAARVQSRLDPLVNPAAQQFLQWLQANPDSANAAGDVLAPPGAPVAAAVPLDAALVAALRPLLADTSAWIVDEPAFEGIAWAVEPGIVPGPESPQPAGGAWRLTTLGPVAGLCFSAVDYAATPRPGFTLTLVNARPRHLGVYAAFTKAGQPVVPAGWTSRLPAGVPAGYETDTVKYLGVLAPNAAVAGIAVDAGPQTIAVALPDGADAVQVLFGGLGGRGFAAVPDAAGAILTLVLDVFVPWLVQRSGTSPGDLATWFDRLVRDPAIVAAVLTGGSCLLEGIEGADAMLAALSDRLTGIVLGAPLAPLRAAVAEALGPVPGGAGSWVDRLAPAAGWPAQLVRSVLAGGPNPRYWVAAMATPIACDLSPATTLALDVAVRPDPASGLWPYRAATCEVAIAYAAGFSQTLTAALPPAPDAGPLQVAFGSVRALGPIRVTVTLRDDAGAVLAAGAGLAALPVAGSRTAAAQVVVADTPVAVAAASGYVLAARLTCTDGVYAWDATVPRSTAVGLAGTPQGPALTSLNSLSLQAAELCLGYAWGAANQAVPACTGGPPLQTACFLQNVGTAMPAAQLRTIGCGLAVAPLLAYGGADRPDAPHTGFYLDGEGAGLHLRPAPFGPGRFDPRAARSVARFPTGSVLADLALHPAGCVAGVSPDLGLVQIVVPAPEPVAEADAPTALSYGGTGSRVGLFGAPVAVAATPGGAFLVLEDANARVQAIDPAGNPVAVFDGQATFALPVPAHYRDIAVSPAGLIHVLGSRNGAARPDDFFLATYDAAGRPLCETAGVNAARIAVGANEILYTLDFDALTGPGGRTEPVLSAWRLA